MLCLICLYLSKKQTFRMDKGWKLLEGERREKLKSYQYLKFYRDNGLVLDTCTIG